MSSRTAERADHGTAARPGDRGIDPWWLAAVPLVALAWLPYTRAANGMLAPAWDGAEG